MTRPIAVDTGDFLDEAQLWTLAYTQLTTAKLDLDGLQLTTIKDLPILEEFVTVHELLTAQISQRCGEGKQQARDIQDVLWRIAHIMGGANLAAKLSVTQAGGS